MKIVVLGAGAWGTALAIGACRSAQGAHAVTLWARDAEQVQAMAQARTNARYLPGIAFPPTPATRQCGGWQLASLVGGQRPHHHCDTHVRAAPHAAERA